MTDFKEYVEPIIGKFKRSRQTRFAKSHNVSPDDVHAHNMIPIWYLAKEFKTMNGIKSRLFKSLSEEQKSAWLTFYDQRKQITLMTTKEHEKFHSENVFDVKRGGWRNTSIDVDVTTAAESKPTRTRAKKKVSESIPPELNEQKKPNEQKKSNETVTNDTQIDAEQTTKRRRKKQHEQESIDANKKPKSMIQQHEEHHATISIPTPSASLSRKKIKVKRRNVND